MAKKKTEEKKQEQITVLNIEIGMHNDNINPIYTLSFKDSKDIGIQLSTSNLQLTIRMSEKEYFGFTQFLMSYAKELGEQENNEFQFLEDLEDYIINKMDLRS